MWIAVVVLGVLCLLLGAYLAALMGEVRRMSRSLDAVTGTQTNARLYTLVGNRHFRELAAKINRLLDTQAGKEQQVRQADRAFKESVTGVSHDLRTPLTSISGYLQMLKDPATPAEKREEYWSVVERRLESLLGLLDELFAYTRLETGELELRPETLRLDRLLPEQLAQYYQAFADGGLSPEVEIPAQPVQVFCDRGGLERIVQNLMKNALVHGRGRFLVTLESAEGEALLRFANGAEAPQVDPQRLFDRFYTGDKSRSAGGTGLGLAIVRQLAQRMGGGVSARWREELLEITVRLPLAGKE